MPQLLVGLGNPGPKYTETRHNAGFWFVERLAGLHSARFRRSARLHGETALLRVDGRDCRLFKPATFMNDSGRAVQAALHFYALEPGELCVMHDEIDLPPGAARLKRGGGPGGHNGVRDVIRCLGSGEFLRLRLGVGHPGRADDVVEYVLKRPPAAERELIDAAMARALEVMPLVLKGDVQKAMKELHTSERKRGMGDKP
jgi:PTH1 family peptidyl-tRNA hydrolase